MDQLAQDLFVALEESESCGPIHFEHTRKWGLRRKTRSAENLNVYANNIDHSDENSSSSNSEIRPEEKIKIIMPDPTSFHHSDSDDMSLNFCSVDRALNSSRTQSLRMKHPLQNIFRGRCKGVSYSLESDSLNETTPQSPGGGKPGTGAARPSQRRKRKLKRMSVDEETPHHHHHHHHHHHGHHHQHYYSAQCGKRKRAHRGMDCSGGGAGEGAGAAGSAVQSGRVIRPLHPSVVDKIERWCAVVPLEETEVEIDEQHPIQVCHDTPTTDSSLSWSGGEGHDGDDELTDWAPAPDLPTAAPLAPMAMDTSSIAASSCGDAQREVRAGCRRLGDEPTRGFTISTAASERVVARFVQDANRTELQLGGGGRYAGGGAGMVGVDCVDGGMLDTNIALERDKLSQLAALYSLDLWFDGAASLLRKTARTPFMRPLHTPATPSTNQQQQQRHLSNPHQAMSTTSFSALGLGTSSAAGGGGGGSIVGVGGATAVGGHKKIRTTDRTKS